MGEFPPKMYLDGFLMEVATLAGKVWFVADDFGVDTREVVDCIEVMLALEMGVCPKCASDAGPGARPRAKRNGTKKK